MTDNIIDNIEKNNKSSLKEYTKTLCDNEILKDTDDYSKGFKTDVVDSRDIQRRIDRLNVLIMINRISEDRMEELNNLEDLKADCFQCADKFEYGITLIKDDYFYDYAKEQAEDCGFIENNPKFTNPIYNFIDWKEWAEFVKQDYSEVTYLGGVYFVR